MKTTSHSTGSSAAAGIGVATEPPAPKSSLDVTALALRHKWILLGGLCAGLVLGELAYLQLGPSYLATAKILVSRRTNVPLRPDQEERAGYGERGEHIALIMSPMIVGKAVEKHHLDQLASLQGEPEPIQEIVEGLKVKRTAGSDQSALNVLELTFESRTPQDAAKVIDGIVDSYGDYLRKAHQDFTAETLALVTQANEKLLKELHEKEQEYIEFRKNSPLHWRSAPGTAGQPGDASNVHQERVTAIEAERRLNLLKRTEIQSRLKSLLQAQDQGESQEALELLVRRFLTMDGAGNTAGVAAGIAAGLPGGTNPVAAIMENRLLPLILEEQKLLRDFGADHPDVKAIRKSIRMTREFFEQQGLTLPDALKDQVKKSGEENTPANGKAGDLVAIYIASLKQQLEELTFRDTSLAGLFDKESKAAKDFSHYQLEDQTLNGEIKRLNGLWEQITNRLSELSLLKDNGGYDLKLVSPPREELSLKRQLKFLGGGAAAVLLTLFGLIYLRAMRDTTLKSVEEIQQELGLAVIGRVPQFDPAEIIPATGSAFDRSLVYLHDPGSFEAEAYRSLRTALFVSTHKNGEKVIQVTSPEPQDGKSTVAGNLALAMSQSGKKVLLVDADLRCPKVHKLFGLAEGIGLSDVLAGEIELSTAFRETEADGLMILSAGITPTNPAEMLGSARFEQVLRDVRSQFDFVIVDTPPLLAVSDPCVVAANTEGLLLVLRLEKNRRAAAERAVALLDSHGIPVLGAVANGLPTGEEYGKGYAYGSAYATSTRAPASSARASRKAGSRKTQVTTDV